MRRKNGSNYEQFSLFGSTVENPPLREAIEFYKHAHNWSNRFIAGNSLLVMKAEIDEEAIEAYRGTVSLPFEPGKHRRIDDRGIESLQIIELS